MEVPDGQSIGRIPPTAPEINFLDPDKKRRILQLRNTPTGIVDISGFGDLNKARISYLTKLQESIGRTLPSNLEPQFSAAKFYFAEFVRLHEHHIITYKHSIMLKIAETLFELTQSGCQVTNLAQIREYVKNLKA